MHIRSSKITGNHLLNKIQIFSNSKLPKYKKEIKNLISFLIFYFHSKDISISRNPSILLIQFFIQNFILWLKFNNKISKIFLMMREFEMCNFMHNNLFQILFRQKNQDPIDHNLWLSPSFLTMSSLTFCSLDDQRYLSKTDPFTIMIYQWLSLSS